MGKYDPLEGHLRRQKSAIHEMSFRDIERVLGGLLPKSAHRPEWWSNEQISATRHVQCKAWMRAGYRAFPQTHAERVRFERRMAANASRDA
ncbi:hypothetical protein DJ021_10355 [Phenylobacterium hankyongense]|uniref:DUF7662 domain-containing protein n=1 Tax=Phenylobacterium hankyongense TaxID=1813876 RepID=A0A328B2V9_9CAUL|nr:hypothetical protein [Phenylobacterium hankyongense]RAK60174.1 hypothetical protein DJ021_10355 [Phenylobacterium hankyongense]